MPKDGKIKGVKLAQRQKGDVGSVFFEQCIEEAGIKDGVKVVVIHRERKHVKDK